MRSGQVTHLATVQSRTALIVIPQHSVGVAAEVMRLAPSYRVQNGDVLNAGARPIVLQCRSVLW